MLAREEWSIPKVQPVDKPDVFSLESLIAWLEKMPPRESYRTWELDNCLLGQWSQAMGAADFKEQSYQLGIAEPFLTIASIDGPRDQPHTFGAALTRARAALR